MSNRTLPTIGNSTSISHLHAGNSVLATRGRDAVAHLTRIKAAEELFAQAMVMCASVDFDRLSNPGFNRETRQWNRPLTPSQQEAEPLLRQAAELGHNEAAFHLAAFVIDMAAGIGQELGLEERENHEELQQLRLPLIKEALGWYRQAANGGSIPAQKRLGHILLYGRFRPMEGVKNRAEAEIWLTLAAQAGDAEAQTDLGQLLTRPKGREKESLYWFRQAAEQGVTFAQVRLAEYCLKEIEGIPADYAQAMHWLHAVLTNPQRNWINEDEVNTILGVAYLTGLAGVEQDFSKAFELLSLVASREEGLHLFMGHSAACQLVGYMREFGLGSEKDIEAAHRYYDRVEIKNHVKSWGEKTFGTANSFEWDVFDLPQPRKSGLKILDDLKNTLNSLVLETQPELKNNETALRSARQKLWKEIPDVKPSPPSPNPGKPWVFNTQTGCLSNSNKGLSYTESQYKKVAGSISGFEIPHGPVPWVNDWDIEFVR